MDTIRFILNGAEVEITDQPPMRTLLDWLRYERRLTGSKEGCAEGDCGACTVALREVVNGQEKTRPVCACIQTLGMVHGREIVTVDGLDTDGLGNDGLGNAGLDPIQQAIADNHGAQCGFCTPGIVMALWAHGQAGGARDRQSIEDALGGNLCRCTGYGPILEAAEATTSPPRPVLVVAETGPLTYRAAGRAFHAPVSLEALLDLRAAHPDATILSGATDVGLWVTKHGFDPAEVLYTGRVAALQRIEVSGETLTLGAGVTYRDAFDTLAEAFPGMRPLLRRIGGAQVRAAGTIGGNIANGSPIGDMPPALIAAGATLVLASTRGERAIALEDFFVEYGRQDLAPDEIVARLEVPLAAGERLVCHKVSKRFDQDITAVLGCFDIGISGGTIAHARLAYGGMAGIPARARAAEAVLTGQPWTEATVRAAMAAMADDFTPLTDMRASAGYRMQTAQNLLLRHYLATTGVPTDVRAPA